MRRFHDVRWISLFVLMGACSQGTVSVTKGSQALSDQELGIGKHSQNQKIAGALDEARKNPDGSYTLMGWACQTGRHDSIVVHFYATNDDAGMGQLVGAVRAYLPAEQAVHRICGTKPETGHRFEVHIPYSTVKDLAGKHFNAYGIGVGSDNGRINAAAHAIDARRPKLVVADYHSWRFTRAQGGTNGNWSIANVNPHTAVESKKVTIHDADLLDEKGRHDIAAKYYPRIGMQSYLDPDVAEYQVLTAKMAGIDAFAAEWGGSWNSGGKSPQVSDEVNHEATVKNLMKAAEKHGFQIGASFLDGHIFLNGWHDPAKPTIDQFRDEVEYLLRLHYSGPSALLLDGKPLIFTWGMAPADELTISNFPSIVRNTTYNLGNRTIAGSDLRLIRQSWGWISGGQQVYTDYAPSAWGLSQTPKQGNWHQVYDGAWASMVRTDGSADGFDKAVTSLDRVLQAARAFRVTTAAITPKELVVASAQPEFDNTPCSAWGSHEVELSPRNFGTKNTYEELWREHVANKTSIDMVYVPTWNDYTESTVIEPTMETGFRDVLVTSSYGAEFKEIPNPHLSEGDFRRVEFLFKARKRAATLKKLGIDTAAPLEDAQGSSLDAQLEQLAGALATYRYASARHHESIARAALRALNRATRSSEVAIDEFRIQRGSSDKTLSAGEVLVAGSGTDTYATIPAARATPFQGEGKTFSGTLSFWLKDDSPSLTQTDANGNTTINEDHTLRVYTSKGRGFFQVAQVHRRALGGAWRKIVIPIDEAVARLDVAWAHFAFTGTQSASIKDLRLEVKVREKK